MSIIIRLQNLPWAANSVDIRRYFVGLSIPEGGVHIVGGEKGDAFIAFSTDEDARQAMERDGGKIKDMKVKLLLSSRAEMTRVIEQARNQTLSLQTPSAVKAAANDSDRRKLRDRSPSPSRSRKDREKSPPRDRRKTTYSKRDRSRSPQRRVDRDRDTDRRSDRSKRDDRSRYDDRGDSRYKGSRDYNSRDSSSQDRKTETSSKVQSEPIQNKPFDPQVGATPQTFDSRHLDGGSLRTGGMEFNPRQGNLPDNSASFVASRSSESGSTVPSYTFPAAMNMAPIKLEVKSESLPTPFPPLEKLSSLFASKPPMEAPTSGNYETKRPSPTPAALAPKVESTSPYGKGYSMTSRADPYNSVSSNFGNCPDPTASTYGTVQTAEKGAIPAVPHDRKNIISSKPVYGAEPHARYEQIPEANQASRSSTAPVPANDSGPFNKMLPSTSPSEPSASSNVKPRRSRFEPEISTPQEIPFPKATNDPRPAPTTYSSRPSDTTSHPRQSDSLSSRESNLGIKDAPWLGQQLGGANSQRPPLLTPPQRPNEYAEVAPMDVDIPSNKNITNMSPSNRGSGNPQRRDVGNHDFRSQQSRGYFPNNPDHPKNNPFEERTPPRAREQPPLNESRRGPPLNQNQNEDLPSRGRNGESLKRGLSALTVIIKDLPYDVTENNVLGLLQGIFVPPENFKLQYNNRGVPVAYVKFVKPRDYDEALSRSRQKNMANMYPEILQCSLAEFENASPFNVNSRVEKVGPPPQGPRRQGPRPREEDLCVEIEGLPASCTEDDLVQVFDGLGILDIIIQENLDNRGNKLGFVEFGTPADFHAALNATGKMINHRYITVNVSSKEMMNLAQTGKRSRKEPVFPQPSPRDPVAPLQRAPNKNQRPVSNEAPVYCVAINGLPEIVKNRDIADFFAEDNLYPRAIHIMLDAKKLPSGEAFIEFSGIEDFDIALQSNGKILVGSRVSVNPITHKEMTGILKGPVVASPAPLLKSPPEDRPSRRPLMPPPREEDINYRERRPPSDDMSQDNFGPNRHRQDSRYPPNDRAFEHSGSPGPRPPFSRMRAPASSRPGNRPQRPPMFGNDGPAPHFGSDGPPSHFGSNGPPSRIGSDGPPSRFGSDGPPSRFGSDGPPSRIGSDGPPSRIGSDGPPSRIGSDGPPSRFGSDGPPSRFGSDGPPSRFGSDGPPSRFGSDGPPSRFGSDGPPSRFGPDGPPSRFGPDGPPSRFGPDGPPSRFGPDGPPSRFGPDGPPSRFGPDGPPSRFGPDGPPTRFGPDGPPARFGPDGPPAHFGSDGPSPRLRPTGPQRGPQKSSGPQDFGKPGCVVAINNLHFRAGLDEIMESFHGFPLDKDKIIRKYNDKGQATGEARIAFRCHEDAIRAVEEINQKIIFGRPIYLSLA